MSASTYPFFLAAPTATIQEGIPRTERFMLTNDSIVCSISGGADSGALAHRLRMGMEQVPERRTGRE